MLAISGRTSTIAGELAALLPEWEQVKSADRPHELPLTAERYLFCNGLLLGIAPGHMTTDQHAATWKANFADIAEKCLDILAANDRARIVVIGSESAYRGSFDGAYAEAKQALHRFVEGTRLAPGQQMVAISPGIIENSGMTRRRKDQGALRDRMFNHPKRRFLTALEVARMAHFLLYIDEGYTSGVVIRMHGGDGR